MAGFAFISFTAPWALAGLAALPVIWWLLRATPPAPVRRIFPGVGLLFGLKDEDSTPDRTPWWLLLLRMTALAAMVVGFAGPVLNPRPAAPGSGPLLVLVDGGMFEAADWSVRAERLGEALAEAGRRGRPVAVVSLAAPLPAAVDFAGAAEWAARAGALTPEPFAPDLVSARDWLAVAGLPDRFDTLWLADGLDHPGRAALAAALAGRGTVRVIETGAQALALSAPRIEEGAVVLDVVRASPGLAETVGIEAIGPDPAGLERVLARAEARFDAPARTATARLALPLEQRNRVSRFRLAGRPGAAGVALADDGLRRRKVLLVAGGQPAEADALLSPLHYLRQALAPGAELIEVPLMRGLDAAPDAVILADVAGLGETEAARLAEWVEAGGLLIRFAGPRLAAHTVETRGAADPLLPVRLRIGGRSVGGTMSWGAPRSLRPFSPDSPFFGLEIPPEVAVTAQVVAQPGPELGPAVIAALDDGTPLVTRKRMGEGRVVLFHVTANAEWSSLPLSRLFIGMLERLTASAGAAGRVTVEDEARWRLAARLDGYGALSPVEAGAEVTGADLRAGPSRTAPPGLYATEGRSLALNAYDAPALPGPAAWPAGVQVERLEGAPQRRLGGWLLAAALILLALDVIGTLAAAGRLARTGPAGFGGGKKRSGVAPGLAVVLGLSAIMAGLAAPPRAHAEPQFDEAFALAATRETVLAYVRTGDARLDALSEAGLRGLGRVLAQRTSVEPGPPMGVDLERDELALFPMLYWPISARQPRPSDAAYEKLNAYLRSGGLILFDTRDADLSAALFSTPNARRLRELAAPLAIPPLEPVPEDHVLTRSFYLLHDFPGRHARGQVWVEAAPPDAKPVPGLPFRILNDGVTPVVIGGNDWASAWAMDEVGRPLYPVGRGAGGARQRELAWRFGVNLVMHVLTGNYKSDQVHVPALLERLGQ